MYKIDILLLDLPLYKSSAFPFSQKYHFLNSSTHVLQLSWSTSLEQFQGIWIFFHNSQFSALSFLLIQTALFKPHKGTWSKLLSVPLAKCSLFRAQRDWMNRLRQEHMRGSAMTTDNTTQQCEQKNRSSSVNKETLPVVTHCTISSGC